ncbi:MAG: hypothetical protein ACRD6W_18920, partial [Nitrososphaerales archaeon]
PQGPFDLDVGKSLELTIIGKGHHGERLEDLNFQITCQDADGRGYSGEFPARVHDTPTDVGLSRLDTGPNAELR